MKTMKKFIEICIILLCFVNVQANIDILEPSNDATVLTALFEKLNWLILETKMIKENLKSVTEKQSFNENLRVSNLRNTRKEIHELFQQQDLKMQKLFIELDQQMLKNFEQQLELYKNTSAELIAAKAFSISNFKENRHWQCILRRQDGSVNFDRNWFDYKQGFGHANGEFFIGLEKLHAMSNYEEGHLELLFILQDFNNETRYVKYNDFAIGSEREKYKIKSIGTYEGDAGDSFSQHLNATFTTKDQSSSEAVNCAESFKGGWWFKNCYNCHLTGPYLNHSSIVFPKERGIVWNAWHGSTYSLKFVEMLIKVK